jgi:hypothetical protein
MKKYILCVLYTLSTSSLYTMQDQNIPSFTNKLNNSEYTRCTTNIYEQWCKFPTINIIDDPNFKDDSLQLLCQQNQSHLKNLTLKYLTVFPTDDFITNLDSLRYLDLECLEICVCKNLFAIDIIATQQNLKELTLWAYNISQENIKYICDNCPHLESINIRTTSSIIFTELESYLRSKGFNRINIRIGNPYHRIQAFKIS